MESAQPCQPHDLRWRTHLHSQVCYHVRLTAQFPLLRLRTLDCNPNRRRCLPDNAPFLNHTTGYSVLSPHNDRYCLRHGQSEATAQYGIDSDPTRAVVPCGLTTTGRKQVIDRFASPYALNSNTRIFCAYFKRAHETSLLVAKCLDSSNPITIDSR